MQPRFLEFMDGISRSLRLGGVCDAQVGESKVFPISPRSHALSEALWVLRGHEGFLHIVIGEYKTHFADLHAYVYIDVSYPELHISGTRFMPIRVLRWIYFK